VTRPRNVVVTNADCEPGRTIAATLARAGLNVSVVTPQAVAQVERIDALVNCYRLESDAAGAVEDLDIDTYLRAVSNNLTDAFFASQAAALQMISNGRTGIIVNVTSVAGVVALPGHVAFCSSMAAVSSLTKVLATEWAPRGIRVAAVGAGLSPDLLEGLRELPGASRRVPPGALVDRESLAQTVHFVLSDGGRGIAGVPIYVDAGWLADGYWEPFP
jgi:NAD(P)-dependent dehydrogenase (short-subunit alcohol dehydrogenase family)